MTYADRVNADILYQTDPRFPWYVQRYGCRWRSIAAIAEMVAGRALTFKQLMDLLEENRSNSRVLSFLNDQHMLCGPDEHMIGNTAFAYLESPRALRQVGMYDAHGSLTMWAPTQWQYQIIHWRTAGADGHYSVGDRASVEIFDPWNQDEATSEQLRRMKLREDYVMHKRAVRRRLLYSIWRTG